MPKFSLGDQVQLLDSKEKGIIVKIQGNLLTISFDGFEYEVSDNEVILIPDSSTKNIAPINEKQEDLQEGFYVLLDIEQHWITIYLLNYSACYLHFIANHKGKNLEYLLDGCIEPFKHQRVKRVSMDTFIQEAKLQMQFLSCFKNAPEKNRFFQINFEPTQKIFNRKNQYVKSLKKEVIVFPLEFLTNKTIQTNSKIPVYLKNKNQEPQVELNLEMDSYLEFDLHIEKLTDKPLQVHDPLSFQLKKAEEFLYQAIKKKCSKVVFIHGGGKNKLKQELIDLLKRHPNISEFGTADIQKYGLGATYFILKV